MEQEWPNRTSGTPSFKDITTIGVGGTISIFEEPTSRAAFIEAIVLADVQKLPLCIIGGGSNMLVSDEDFHGVVVRDARREILVLDEAAPVEEGDVPTVTVSATAGVHWDDLVEFCVRMGLSGVEALSGIPGTVGASVVQNIGAYGQEVKSTVVSVEVWDRELNQVRTLSSQDLEFNYRTSVIKQSMYDAGQPSKYFPSPRYVVLEVVFKLKHSSVNVVDMDQLARALHVDVGQEVSIAQIREAVLFIRESKGMVEDEGRYVNPWMKNTTIASTNRTEDTWAIETSNRDKWSCGSFFINPVISPEQAQTLPEDAPRFATQFEDGNPAVKTSAAWLIDHAGFKPGFAITTVDEVAASLSSRHTLALTNRGNAYAADIVELARHIRNGVQAKYGITLVPEPVFIGVTL